MMKYEKWFGIIIVELILTLLFSYVAYSESILSSNDIEKIDQIGEEFQRQVPWSRVSEKGRELTGDIVQPQSYLLGGQKEEPESKAMI